MELSDKIVVQVDEADHEVFMSFGLLNRLAKIIGSPELVPSVLVFGELRDQVLQVLLTKRNRAGKVVGEAVEDVDDVFITRADAERLLSWAMEHVLDFFVVSFRTLKEMSERRAEDLEVLVSSGTGSSDSPSKN